GDEVVLQSTFSSQEEHVKLCLAAEGFGSRLCRLEPTSNCKKCSTRPVCVWLSFWPSASLCEPCRRLLAHMCIWLQ
ncbi:hypothetical protein KUCAC02_023888, partial [Chaenocephalus aceratus]